MTPFTLGSGGAIIVVGMGTKKGTKFTPEHVRRLVESRLKSAAFWDGRRRASEKLQGRAPSDRAIAGSLATRTLRMMGTTRQDSPALWEIYRDLALKRLLESRSKVAA